MDIIKNRINFLNPENFDNYQYNISDIVTYDNNTVYKISFNPAQNIKNPSYSGNLYINNKNFALITAEFHLNLKKAEKNLNFISKKKIENIV